MKAKAFKPAECPAFILLDYPFAYVHNGLKSHIDYAIFIDTPLDVAMARRMLRDYREPASLNLASEIIGYPEGGRRAYLEMLRVVLPSSDCSIDGAWSVNALNEQILERVRTLRSERSISYESS